MLPKQGPALGIGALRKCHVTRVGVHNISSEKAPDETMSFKPRNKTYDTTLVRCMAGQPSAMPYLVLSRFRQKAQLLTTVDDRQQLFYSIDKRVGTADGHGEALSLAVIAADQERHTSLATQTFFYPCSLCPILTLPRACLHTTGHAKREDKRTSNLALSLSTFMAPPFAALQYYCGYLKRETNRTARKTKTSLQKMRSHPPDRQTQLV